MYLDPSLYQLDCDIVLYLDEHYPKVSNKTITEINKLSDECDVIKKVFKLANDAHSEAQDASDYIKDRTRNADAQAIRQKFNHALADLNDLERKNGIPCTKDSLDEV